MQFIEHNLDLNKLGGEMELIKFDEDYINIHYIIAIEAPKQNGHGNWEIGLKTYANHYPYYVWEFTSQFEAEQEFKKLVDRFKI